MPVGISGTASLHLLQIRHRLQSQRYELLGLLQVSFAQQTLLGGEWQAVCPRVSPYSKRRLRGRRVRCSTLVAPTGCALC